MNFNEQAIIGDGATDGDHPFDRSKFGVSLMTITPETARAWLAKNVHNNRNKKWRIVRQIARAITEGRWKLDGATIKFNALGELIDGQHRLEAIVFADLAVRSLVVWGIDESAFDVIDTGTARNAGDTLSHLGHENANALAAIARVLIQDQRKQDLFRADATNAEVAAYVQEFPDILIGQTWSQRTRQLVIGAVGGYCFVKMYRIDPVLAEAFWSTLRTGENLASDDPVYVLRERLLRQSKFNRMQRNQMTALITLAWNACRKGMKIARLSWSPNDPIPIFE